MQWNNVYCNLELLTWVRAPNLLYIGARLANWNIRLENDVINSIFLDLGACVLIKSIKFVFSGADLASFSSKFPFAIFLMVLKSYP